MSVAQESMVELNVSDALTAAPRAPMIEPGIMPMLVST